MNRHFGVFTDAIVKVNFRTMKSARKERHLRIVVKCPGDMQIMNAKGPRWAHPLYSTLGRRLNWI